MGTRLSASLTSALAAAALFLGVQAPQAQTIDLKLANFLPQPHVVSRWLDDWAAEIAEKSDGRLTITMFHGAQMGPVPRHYDIARTGQADLAYFMHGGTPGRFPVTEISNLPFLFCSAQQAMNVLNDPELRDGFLVPEHRGVEVMMLFAHPPGQLNASRREVTRIEDLDGMAIRPPSQATAEFLETMGVRPVGLPVNELAEGLQRGTIDALLTDYGAAGLAWQLGPYIRHVTEIFAYTTSMGLVANPDSLERLPEDLRALLVASLEDRVNEVARAWDALDGVGKQALIDAGATITVLEPAEMERLHDRGREASDRWAATVDAGGAPGSDALALMRALIEKYPGSEYGCAG